MSAISQDAPLPRGFLAWIPYLWSRVLFPGTPEIESRIRPLSLGLLILLPAALLYPTRSFHLLEPDEARYAQIAREMQDDGAWVVPTLQGKPYLDKPPLMYWLVRLSYGLFGVSEEAARLIPALAVHGAILLVYLLGRRSLGERSAFWGALLLTVAPGFIGMGRLLILDGLLSICVTLCIFSAFEAIRGRRISFQLVTDSADKLETYPTERLVLGWWLLSAFACGLGILTKGPVALILFAPPILAYRWLSGQRVPIGWKNALLYLVIAAAVNLPWYVAIYRHEPVFLRYFFWEHNVMRFIHPFDHLQPFWYYLPILLGGLLPGSILLYAFVRHLTSGEEATMRTRSAALGFWLLAGVWCVVFFSMSGCKLPTYVLPAFPFLTLALGDFIARTKWDRSRWSQGGIAVAAGIMAFAHYVAVPWYAQQRSPMANRELVAKYCADPETPVVCFPRNVDSVAFYLNRDDLRNVRTKESISLIQDLMSRPRTVVLFTHNHSLGTLMEVLPKQLRVTETVSLRRNNKSASVAEKLSGDSPWGLCDIAVIERVQ